MAGWIHRRQQLAIAYLQARNRVLRERLGTGRLRFTDAERRLLAEKGQGLGLHPTARGAAIGGRPHSAADPVFGQDGVPDLAADYTGPRGKRITKVVVPPSERASSVPPCEITIWRAM